MDHGSFPKTGLCVTDSTSTPVRLVLGPVLVHRRCRLSASAPQCVETETPGHHGDSRADSQWMLGSGVAPELVVVGVGNKWVRAVTKFLLPLRKERDPVRMCIRLRTGGFLRTHALVVS